MRKSSMGVPHEAIILAMENRFDSVGFKITTYADRLLQDLELLDWPASVKNAKKIGFDP